MNEWNKYVPREYETYSNTLSIIEDALCFGFEFKVENHNLYYREKEN